MNEEDQVPELQRLLDETEREVAELRHRLAEAPHRVRVLEESLLQARGQLAQATQQNDKLATTLHLAKENIAVLRDEVEKLSQPPASYGTFLKANEDGTVDVVASGRKMRVATRPDVDGAALERGAEVVLNESMNVVLARDIERSGEVVTIVEVLEDRARALVTGRGDGSRVVEISPALANVRLRGGDSVLLETRSQLLVELLPKQELEEVVLEEVPDITYADIGGLDEQIEAITDAVELPFLHRELFVEHRLPAPKGILLYGPPGCGKTLIAKAVANSLAKKVSERTGDGNARSYFLNIKGPELLNKYVGETERQIRVIFERAREKAEEGVPVIVFFDEMDSLFRTRGSGISSDMESTVVPQLLTEIDGVERLRNVIVIGASNREDLIDPAILRPGRLDVKIKIERPSAAAAEQVFARYLTPDLPLDAEEVKSLGGGDPAKAVQAMIEQTVEEMYKTDNGDQFLEVTYQNGDKEVLYFKDFASGAMIENIVSRAKKLAIKRFIANNGRGIKLEHLLESIKQEYKENEDLPNTTNPDDWAKISGRKGERIVYVRTIIEHGDEVRGGREIERVKPANTFELSGGRSLMAVKKVLGIETEYGIHVKGPNNNPTAASSLLINAYVNGLASKVNWDFDDEAPHRDARGFLRNGGIAPIVDSHLFNTVLTNGARYYVDHAHPEYSSPECSTVLEALAFDRAGEVILQRSMEAANKVLSPGEEIVIYKNNSDGKGNSYGCHENYLVARAVPFAQIARDFTPFLVTRQLFTGSGKVGCEEEGSRRAGFEITQRADFVEEEVGLETTMRRPIINSRDEPHADANNYRRLHVITGDANLAEVANFLKMGTSALMLTMIEDGIFASGDLALSAPVKAMHDVSHDLTISMKLELADGVTVTALELQWEIYELARAYADSHDLSPLGPPEVGAMVLDQWERVLNGLEHDPSSLKRQLDWVAKYELIQAYCDRHSCTIDDPRISALDLQYHDLRPEKSLFARLGTERLIDETEVQSAVTNPPQTTRAYFRGECLRHFPDSIVAANWDSIIFDTGEAALRRIPMMDPLRGSAAHVGTLFDECKSPAELIARLEG